MFLNGGAGKDTLTGGADADTLYGNGGDDKVTGNGGDDVLTGGAGNDTISGGDGDDYLMGDAGNDRLDGGAGSDWAGYESANAAVKVDLSLTTAQNTGGGGTDTLLNIENVYGTAYADTLTGSAANNMLFGAAGNDSISGGQGDDFMAGGAGADTLSGGDGDDTVSYDDGDTTGVNVNLATGVATGHGTDSLVSIEGVYGSGGDDTLTAGATGSYLGGSGGNDSLTSGSGADYIEGGSGNDVVGGLTAGDVVSGGEGNDTFNLTRGSEGEVTITAGEGDDVLAGDAGALSITFNGGAGRDQVLAQGGSANFDLGGDADFLNYSAYTYNSEVRIDAGDGDDKIYVRYGSNTVSGGDGDDIIVLIQSDSRNYFYGDAGDDVLNSSSAGDVLHGGVGADHIYVMGGHAFGDEGDDYLQARFGSTADGGAGDDRIQSFDGGNTLAGGAGRDYFSIGNSGIGASQDVITDWESQDTIHMSGIYAVGGYAEITASSAAQALSMASSMFSADTALGIVVAQVGNDLMAFQGHQTVSSYLTLVGRTLADVDYGNFI